MQEEVEGRAVNLAVSTSKLTARTVVSAVRVYLRHRKEEAVLKAGEKPVGKQKVKELIGQDQGVTNIDIAKTDLRGFERVARKYGIDYAIRKDSSVMPPKYLVFFKAKDADAMTAAFNEYSDRALNKSERPSVLAHLRKLKELVAALPGKAFSRDRQREHTR
ncbi:MAG: PcfB family protein [Oscillospiraceae bacterium]|nr:PcfB family protein [Oscillospiraceae bacterium]